MHRKFSQFICTRVRKTINHQHRQKMMLRHLIRRHLTAAASARSPPTAPAPAPVSGQPALKTLEIAGKYSPLESADILATINRAATVANLQRFDITKGRAQAIRSWRNKNGPIASVEQLLELDGFGVKNVDKLCASILRQLAQKEAVAGDSNLAAVSAPAEDEEDTVKPIARMQQFTSPALSDALRSRLRSCTAIHVGINSICWARLQLADPHANTETTVGGGVPQPACAQLTDWRLRNISDKRMHVGELAEMVQDIVEELPAADCYVLESPRVAQQGAPGSPAMININVQMAQMIGMVTMAMAARGRKLAAVVEQGVERQEGEDASAALGASPADARRVLFLRQLLASRLFQTVVGLERISTASVVAALLEQSERTARGGRPEKQVPAAPLGSSSNPLAGEVRIAPSLQYAYTEADGYCKEYMGQALLMALAFVRLCVLRCPDSLAAVSRQKKK